MSATDETTGLLVFTTPGFEHNDLALVTCSFVAPITVPLAGHTIVVSGQMTPASG